MAYVQPNSIIQLFKGINLDNRYMHTIYFANESAQNTWFSGKVYQTYQQQSYTRYTRNSVKLKVDATSVMDCTYLRFMNDRSVDKWFYAFILSIEYINENTTLITYEIDVMQTWFIQNGSVRPCMVKREHVNDDTFGINLEVEPVGSQEYDCDSIELSTGSVNTGFFNNYSLVIQTTGDPSDDAFTSHKYYNNGIFDGTRYIMLPCNSESEAQTKANILKSLLGGDWDKNVQSADVIDMYTMPTKFCNTDPNDNIDQITVTHPRNFSGYVPKNNKLFSYPYAYLHGTTMGGDDATYRWEYFDGDIISNPNVRFDVYGTPTAGGQVICYPRAYNGVEYNYNAKLVMDNFPKNAYNFDAYQAWIASGGKTRQEEAEKIMLARGITGLIASTSNAVTTGVNSVGGFTNPVSAVNSVNSNVQAIKQVSDTALNFVEAYNKNVYQWKDAQYVPNITKGSSTIGVDVGQHILDFYFFSVHVRADEAKRIDDFFSAYGYAVNKVKAPNLTGRAYWNFVMTENAVIDGDMPASSKEAIGRIFDGGITFWHNGDNVGNYGISTSNGSINNPII